MRDISRLRDMLILFSFQLRDEGQMNGESLSRFGIARPEIRTGDATCHIANRPRFACLMVIQ